MEPQDTNGWPEWKNHVLAELNRLNGSLEDHTEADSQNFEKLTTLILELKLDINTLQTKAGIWGSIAGALMSGIISFFVYNLKG